MDLSHRQEKGKLIVKERDNERKREKGGEDRGREIERRGVDKDRDRKREAVGKTDRQRDR